MECAGDRFLQHNNIAGISASAIFVVFAPSIIGYCREPAPAAWRQRKLTLPWTLPRALLGRARNTAPSLDADRSWSRKASGGCCDTRFE